MDVTAAINHDLVCFFPEWVNPATSVYAEVKLITMNSYPYFVAESATDYGGYHKEVSTNTLSFTSSAIAATLAVSETPSAYPGAPLKYVGDVLSGSYKITVGFSNVADMYTPYIYINFQYGGPIPLHDLCGDNAIFQ